MSEANEQDNSLNTFMCSIMVIIILIFAYVTNQDSPKVNTTDVSIKYVGRERLRSSLKDPDSLEIINERIIRPGRNGGIVGYSADFRAKNGFGGYSVDTFYTE